MRSIDKRVFLSVSNIFAAFTAWQSTRSLLPLKWEALNDSLTKKRTIYGLQSRIRCQLHYFIYLKWQNIIAQQRRQTLPASLAPSWHPITPSDKSLSKARIRSMPVCTVVLPSEARCMPPLTKIRPQEQWFPRGGAACLGWDQGRAVLRSDMCQPPLILTVQCNDLSKCNLP